MVKDPIDWAIDFEGHGGIALESLDQGPTASTEDVFKPVNIAVEDGIYYATVYVDSVADESLLSQSLTLWLGGLKDTDVLHLTVGTLNQSLQVSHFLSLLSALVQTKAKTIVHLDQIVFDTTAYVYLVADTVLLGHAGDLFIPSYVPNRDSDSSSAWRATHDFVKWIVDEAVTKGILTAEEALTLNKGSHVIVPRHRFSSSLNA